MHEELFYSENLLKKEPCLAANCFSSCYWKSRGTVKKNTLYDLSAGDGEKRKAMFKKKSKEF